jgi:hypothetical protein
VDSFLNEIWAETHYHVKRNCVDYFDNLLHRPSAVEDLLELFRREPSMVRLIREHDKKSPDNYRLADGSLDVARVRSDFADGYTIVLDSGRRVSREAVDLAPAWPGSRLGVAVRRAAGLARAPRKALPGRAAFRS